MQVQNIKYKVKYSFHSLICDQTLPLIPKNYLEDNLVCRIPVFVFLERELLNFYLLFSFLYFMTLLLLFVIVLEHRCHSTSRN